MSQGVTVRGRVGAGSVGGVGSRQEISACFGASPFGLPTSLYELRRDKSAPQAGFKGLAFLESIAIKDQTPTRECQDSVYRNSETSSCSSSKSIKVSRTSTKKIILHFDFRPLPIVSIG